MARLTCVGIDYLKDKYKIKNSDLINLINQHINKINKTGTNAFQDTNDAWHFTMDAVNIIDELYKDTLIKGTQYNLTKLKQEVKALEIEKQNLIKKIGDLDKLNQDNNILKEENVALTKELCKIQKQLLTEKNKPWWKKIFG